MNTSWITAIGTLVLLGLLPGCVPNQTDRDPQDPSGKQLFAENCVACHGASGMGDGPMARDLFMPPADLTRLSANNDGVFPRNYVVSTMDGFARGEHFSGAMPEFGIKLAGKTVIMDTGDGVLTPTPAPLVAIADYLESIQIKG